MSVRSTLPRSNVVGPNPNPPLQAVEANPIDAELTGRRARAARRRLVTIYSLLGIDWTKKITNTPSGRAFEYIEQQSGTDFVRFREISNLFA